MSTQPPPVSDQPVLKLVNVECTYGPIRAICGVSLQVRRGEIATVLGPHRAGKTTLLKAISGIVHPRAGTVEFKGEDITAKDPTYIVQEGLSQVPEGRAVFARLSVHDNLRMGAYTRTDRDGVAHDIAQVYGYFPSLRDCAAQDAGRLPAGQRQMLALGRALMARPDLMLLDEPSLGLPPALAHLIFEILVRINRERGTAILLVEQNTAMALAVSDYGYVLESGHIVREDTCARLRESDEILLKTQAK